MTENPMFAKSPHVPVKPSGLGIDGDPGRALLQIIDQLEVVVGSAMRLPATNRVILDRVELLDLVDQLRVAVPDEIQEARDILMEREDLLTHAQSEAERAAAEVREQVAGRVEDSEITEAAKERARQIIAAAVAEATETRSEVNAYALEVLQRLEDELSGNLTTVRGGIRAMREDLRLNELRFPDARAKG